ncbi:MAG: RIP metalloprotease RseP [Planctomycetia bacterium]
MELLSVVSLNLPWNILKVALGLGLVIFVHELGHFLVARWAGVLVERFSIGFGPIVWSRKWGDTEYALSAIPLGGYVKMLGQTDTPEAVEPTEDDRSFQNKSVGWRMGIISAGVIVNVVFGFLCFAGAYTMGVPYLPSVVGTVFPGDPAWNVGLRAGDEVISINGHPRADYEMLLNEVALTNPASETVKMTVKRGDETFDVDIAPVQRELKPIVGVAPNNGLKLAPDDPVLPKTPFAAAVPALAGDDVIIAVDGESVKTYQDYFRLMSLKQAEATTLTVSRAGKSGESATTLDVKVPPCFVRTLGLEMQIGEVTAVQKRSPAAEAVDADGKPSPLLPKDVLKAIDGHVVDELDPFRLGEVVAAKAAKGETVELTVLRPGKELRELRLTMKPVDLPVWNDVMPYVSNVREKLPMSIPSLGLAYRVTPVVRKVAEGSPAAKALTPLQPRDVVKKVTITIEDPKKRIAPRDDEIEGVEDQWPSVFNILQNPLLTKVVLEVERQGAKAPIKVELTPVEDPTWPFPHRGEVFMIFRDVRKAKSVYDAAVLGVERTRLSIQRIYLFLRGLFNQTLSYKHLAGPITIATTAYHVSSDSFPNFILFLGMLSVNLAVINFLPIPVLDGGHMVFLTYEAIRGKQASEQTMIIANYVGLALILGLMLFVFGLDLLRQTGNLAM